MPEKKNVPVHLSLAEAAVALSVFTRTVRRRISDGTIPAYTIGRAGPYAFVGRARRGDAQAAACWSATSSK